MANFFVRGKISPSKFQEEIKERLEAEMYEIILGFTGLGECISNSGAEIVLSVTLPAEKPLYIDSEYAYEEELSKSLPNLLRICDEVVVSEQPSEGTKNSEEDKENVLLPTDDSNMLFRNVRELIFSVRVRKIMIRLNINTVGDLVQKTANDLLKETSFGPVCLEEVRDKLYQLGLKLKGD